LRTSGRSSPGQRARRSSNGDGEPSSGRRGFVAAALWRARSEGEVEEGSTGEQMGEGARASGVRGSSGQRRVSCELHARRGRGEGGRAQLGGGYARMRELTSRAREQREGKAGAGARGAAALTGRPARAERGGGGRGARAGWAWWAERPRGAGEWASFSFLFILELFSLFLFIFSN
jgi:hypothetical protein